MIITKYFVLILSASVFGGIDWFMEVVGAVVGSLLGSIDDVFWMINGFVRDTEVELVGKIVEKLEGAEVGAAFNATAGSVAMVGYAFGSIVESSLQVVLNVVDIAIGFSFIIL